MLIILETISVMLVFVYLWFASLRKPVAWLFGIASSVCSLLFFLKSAYYASMALNGIYAILGVSGYFHWKWLDPHREAAFRLRPIHHIFLVVAVFVFAWAVKSVPAGQEIAAMYFVDLLLAGGSITATWLEIRKETSCWIWWIICNAGYMLLYLINPSGNQPLYIYAFLMFILAVFSWFALQKWRHDSYTENQSDAHRNENAG